MSRRVELWMERRYSDGLHQAIEAKENVKVEAASQTYATITLQKFFQKCTINLPA